MLKAINVVATIGDVGLYLQEKEDSQILLNNHPINVRTAITTTKYKSDSFPLIK
jgi:hypothetical protein